LYRNIIALGWQLFDESAVVLMNLVNSIQSYDHYLICIVGGLSCLSNEGRQIDDGTAVATAARCYCRWQPNKLVKSSGIAGSV
jgi:hypothetical protein